MRCPFYDIFGSWAMKTQILVLFVVVISTLCVMVEGLHSKAALMQDKQWKEWQNLIKNAGNVRSISRIVNGNRLTCQDRQEKLDFSNRLAFIESKLDKRPISEIINPIYVPTNKSKGNQFTYTSFEMDIPCFDGSEPLGRFFKITQFFNFHNTQENNKFYCFFYLDELSLSW